ncbi:hypothetical protein GCM10022224_031130 [Nonomuraea antimicrobica]|uniref:Uncharacterized protein n=1 Tax=Nonomuraea antimicrobica TaxID=561173 RepID=A0ABP7BM28_9ACTN
MAAADPGDPSNGSAAGAADAVPISEQAVTTASTPAVTNRPVIVLAIAAPSGVEGMPSEGSTQGESKLQADP